MNTTSTPSVEAIAAAHRRAFRLTGARADRKTAITYTEHAKTCAACTEAAKK